MKELTDEQHDIAVRLFEAARTVVASCVVLDEPILRHQAIVGTAALRELRAAVECFTPDILRR